MEDLLYQVLQTIRFEGSATEGPMFKSAGQIEEGNPLIEKYPASVANADQINANQFILGKF